MNCRGELREGPGVSGAIIGFVVSWWRVMEKVDGKDNWEEGSLGRDDRGRGREGLASDLFIDGMNYE